MKKNKATMGILIFGLTISQINIPIILASNSMTLNSQDTLNEFKSDLVNDGTLSYPTEVFNLLSSSEKFLYDYTQNGDITLLKKSIDYFCFTTTSLYFEEDSAELFEDKNFNTMFYKIRDEIYKISDTDIQSSLINYYGEKIFIGWRKNKTVTIFRDSYLKIELVDYNMDKNLKSQPRLEYLKNLAIYFSGNPDLDSESDEIPDKNNYPPKDDVIDDDVSIPTEDDKDDSSLPDNGDDSINNDNSSTITTNSFFTEYIRKGNSCIQRVTFYKDGIPVSMNEYSVSKNDYVKCGIYDYVHSTVLGSNVIIDNDYINTNQNEESEYTIHFTINKSAKYPYYFNTGIKVNPSDLSVTYNQLKDALYQLSIHSEGFSVTENNKFLAIIDEKPIVLNKSQETYSKLEVERLLNSFSNSDLKILKPSDSVPGSLESYLSSEQIDKILFNGDEVKLSNSFILLDNKLYAPIEEIASIVGAETDLDESKNLTINYKSIKIKLSVNSKTYYVDKNEKLFTYSPIIHNSQIYSSVDEILTELGYKLVWDSESGELSIYQED